MGPFYPCMPSLQRRLLWLDSCTMTLYHAPQYSSVKLNASTAFARCYDDTHTS